MSIPSLQRIQELARDRDPAARESLTETVRDLFLERGKDLTGVELMLVNEILLRLIREVEASVRAALAHRLARVPNAPREVVVALANDTIDVARPLLVDSTVLGDRELMEIIRNRTQDHQLAIAIRKALSEEVSDALVGTGDPTVITTLLNNADASIASKTMQYLVEQSQRIDAFQQPLLMRRELTPALASRLYTWVSSHLKARILARFPVDSVILNKAAEEAVRDLVGDHRANAKSSEDQLADRLAADRARLPRYIVQALRDGQVPLFISLLSRYTGVPQHLVRSMLHEPHLEAFCVACKASGIDRATFASLYLINRKAVRPNQVSARLLSDLAATLVLYDALPPEGAAILLKIWQTAGITGSKSWSRAPDDGAHRAPARTQRGAPTHEVINVDQSGIVTLNGEPISLEELRLRLGRMVRTAPDRPR